MQNNRSSKLTKNVLLMLVLRGAMLFVSFLYVPLLLNSLSEDGYGIWLTLTSMVAWISMFDIGLGNGLRNKLTEALANENNKKAKVYISTTYFCISVGIIIFLLIFLFISNKFLSWNSILNTDSVSSSELGLLVNIVFIAFGLEFILKLLNSVLFALQLPAISTLITAISQVVAFLLILVLVKIYNVNSLLFLGCVISFTPLIVLALSTLFIFHFKYKELCPNYKYIDLSEIKNLFSLGLKFFVIQIATLFMYQTNNIILANVLGPNAVTEYNISYKYLSIPYIIFTIVVTPIWSSTTDAYARNDYGWIKNIIKKIRNFSLLIIVGIVLCVFIGPYIYKIWLQQDYNVPTLTSIAMAMYLISQILYGIYGYIINGIGKIKLILIVNIILATVYIPIAYLFTIKIGVAGVCLSVFISNMIMYVLTKIQCNKLLNSKAKGMWNK